MKKRMAGLSAILLKPSTEEQTLTADRTTMLDESDSKVFDDEKANC